MLEKFGWSPGEGLGTEKQGIKEHLKPKMKTDNAGNSLGFGIFLGTVHLCCRTYITSVLSVYHMYIS